MHEHEIFNSEEDDILVESKISKEKNRFWQNLFSLNFLPVFLSIISIFLSLFSHFLPIFTTYVVGAIFFFFAFGSALASLIISLIPMIKNKNLTINAQIILSISALIIAIL